MTRRQPCYHEGQLVDCHLSLSNVISAIQEGKGFFVYGVCAACGSLVEREYSASATLPTLQAELTRANALVANAQIVPWLADLEYRVPAEIYIVHPGEGLSGACGRNGMSLSGVHVAGKQFVYTCRCGFEWLVYPQDLSQMIVQGMHRSMAARRALFPQLDNSK